MFRMRRATGITLVLMGGGLAVGLAGHNDKAAECREARARNLPEAERLCASSSGGGSYRSGSRNAGSWSDGHHGSDRGGFGRTAAAHHASFGG